MWLCVVISTDYNQSLKDSAPRTEQEILVEATTLCELKGKHEYHQHAFGKKILFKKLFNFKPFIFYSCVCVSVCHMCAGACGSQRNMPYPPELQMVVSFSTPADMGSRNRTEVPATAASTLNH